MEQPPEPAPGQEAAERPRAILHLDLDAFFAAVEVLENPELEGKPVVVGGSPTGRGVVTSASYPARRFGVRSAMSTAKALALCPEAIVIPARHRLYSSYSKRVMSVLRDTCSLVEQMSIDEAFLDLTAQVERWEDVVEHARRIQERVRREVGLSASVGVATSKLVAKVASDRDKPGGLTVVRPGEEAAFLAPLPVRALPGIGPATEKRLLELDVRTLGQLAETPENELRRRFGRYGPSMARHARGISHSPVVAQHQIKSVSTERTFSRDVADPTELERRLEELCRGVERRLRRLDLEGSTVCLKLRYADFSTLNRQMTLAVPTNDAQVLFQAVLALFRRAWRKGRAVRLLGVGTHRLSRPAGQLRLW